MLDRIVVCDCHRSPMQCQAMILLPSGKTIVCWTGDCGRYYSRLLGYFHLHGLTEAGDCIDPNTRVTKRCPGETCSEKRYMGLVSDKLNGKTAYWCCFKCGYVELGPVNRGVDQQGAA
jgi:hypothetical protein